MSHPSNEAPHVVTNCFINAPTIPTNLSPDPEWKNYSLRNFLTVDPVEDANVLYARTAVKAGHVYPGFVPTLPGSPSNGPVNGFLALQARAPYTDRWASQQVLEQTHHYPNPKCKTSLQPLFQIPGTNPMQSMGAPVSASTVRLLEEDLGFGLNNFLATNPDGDANTLYGRIALKDSRNTIEYHRLPAHQGNEGES